MKLLIAGGGTGGHVFPAIAIAREWLSRGKEREVVLVGTQRGIEMKLVPQAGLPLETLRAAGLKGKGGLTLVKNFATLAPGMLANLLFVRDDPLRDIGNLRSVALTVKRGHPYARADYQPRPIPPHEE